MVGPLREPPLTDNTAKVNYDCRKSSQQKLNTHKPLMSHQLKLGVF